MVAYSLSSAAVSILTLGQLAASRAVERSTLSDISRRADYSNDAQGPYNVGSSASLDCYNLNPAHNNGFPYTCRNGRALQAAGDSSQIDPCTGAGVDLFHSLTTYPCSTSAPALVTSALNACANGSKIKFVTGPNEADPSTFLAQLETACLAVGADLYRKVGAVQPASVSTTSTSTISSQVANDAGPTPASGPSGTPVVASSPSSVVVQQQQAVSAPAISSVYSQPGDAVSSASIENSGGAAVPSSTASYSTIIDSFYPAPSSASVASPSIAALSASVDISSVSQAANVASVSSAVTVTGTRSAATGFASGTATATAGAGRKTGRGIVVGGLVAVLAAMLV